MRGIIHVCLFSSQGSGLNQIGFQLFALFQLTWTSPIAFNAVFKADRSFNRLIIDMSGFEIAGIVLGGFPILIEAAKPLSRYFQGAERWWHFKRGFMTLISTIEDESVAYSQNLELLLTPVDIDPEAKASLQEDSRSKLWHDPEIQAKLRNRIKIQYMPWFLRQLLEMRETLDELRGILPITKNGEVRAILRFQSYPVVRCTLNLKLTLVIIGRLSEHQHS